MSKKRPRRKGRGARFARRSPPGPLPGAVAPVPESPKPVIQVFAYSEHEYLEETIEDLSRLSDLRGRWPVLWINVDGLGDAETIERLGQMFHLHPLALEDVVHTHQRAKVEEYPDGLFIIARMVGFNDHLESEQLSLFLGRDYVLTFQYLPGDSLEPVRERIRANRGTIRKSGADYLAYALLDAVVDGYFPVLERYTELLEELDERLTAGNPHEIMARIHAARSDLLFLRRAIWPHREAINALVRDPNALVADETRFFLRDCLDHIVAIIDLVETYREMCTDLREYCLSSISNRMNEVMKWLTLIATLFIPLSFVAGLYGMNFDTGKSPWNMPELHWYLGYPFALTVMASVAAGMLWFFWRRGWIGPGSAAADEQPANHAPLPPSPKSADASPREQVDGGPRNHRR